MKKVRIGVIGYGIRIDILMDNFHRLPEDIEVTAIADTNPERVKALMLKNGSEETEHKFGLNTDDAHIRKCSMDPEKIHFYQSAEEMLEKEELDGVMVGTNCETHARFAKMVLDKGLPMFLEKPVGVCKEDIQILEECDSKPHAPVVVSFPLRLNQVIQEAKKIIDSGVIGKVDHVQAFNDVSYGFVYFHDWYRDESKAHGLFLQKATHDIDVINYLVGEKPEIICAMKSKQIFKGDMPAGLRCKDCSKAESCMESTYNIQVTRNDTPKSDYCCFAKDTGNEDSGSVIVRYESGMHASYSQNFFARKGAGRRGGRIYGYLGTLEYNFSGMLTVYDHMSDKVTSINCPPSPAGHGGGDFALIKNFIELIVGKTTVEMAPLSAGIESAKICLAAKEASEEMKYVNI